jgi:hypothetical protein
MYTVLVSCQRVCKMWNSIISSSAPLQRHLFFLPDNQTPGPPFQPNPLLQWAFKCTYPLDGILSLQNTAFKRQMERDENTRKWYAPSERINNLTKYESPPNILWTLGIVAPFTSNMARMYDTAMFASGQWERSRMRRYRNHILAKLTGLERQCPRQEWKRLHEAHKRKGASWWRMYISRPAVRKVVYETASPRQPLRRHQTDLDDGLKMGVLWDEICTILMTGRTERWCEWTYPWKREFVRIGWRFMELRPDDITPGDDVPWVAERRRVLAQADLIIKAQCCEDCFFGGQRSSAGPCKTCEEQREDLITGKPPASYWSGRQVRKMESEIPLVLSEDYHPDERIIVSPHQLLCNIRNQQSPS